MEEMKIIAHIYTAFDEKFGIPRQSGLSESARGRIVFEPEYRRAEALLGIEGYSHLWLIWKFSESVREEWSPTVRPPRLGGNKRVGVFATRSPCRPNPMGLSSVRLERVLFDGKEGPELIVSGVDMLNGTPIYDIKPYLSYTDSHKEAVCGFADEVMDYRLEVVWPEAVPALLSEEQRQELSELLSQDPRPGYRHDNEEPGRVYGMSYAGHDIRFTVEDGRLTVVSYR